MIRDIFNFANSQGNDKIKKDRIKWKNNLKAVTLVTFQLPVHPKPKVTLPLACVLGYEKTRNTSQEDVTGKVFSSKNLKAY